ncbi:MAG: TatD family hydrolase [Bacteroidales bacterium]|nr:TatD family hydrolase [Bacteroidales bacterium]
MFIDTHTHYYDEWFGEDGAAAVQRALDAGVEMMLQADVDSRERDRMFALAEQFPGVLRQMLGLYPGSVREDWREEIDAWVSRLDESIVAIGEIGLDYHEGTEFKEQQKEALRVQLEIAAEHNLPVDIHLRDAWDDLFRILEDCRHLHLRGCLHCFSGSYEIYERARRCGDFSVGIGGVVTFKNSRLAETVARIPLEHILLETDCPYLAPVPHRGERNESAFLPYIAEKIARSKNIDTDTVARETTLGARRLFGL